MKKVFAIGILLASVLFTFQPATADTVQPPVVSSTETVITAPVVELSVVETVVTTEPAPVVATFVEPVTESVVETAPVVSTATVTEPVPVVTETVPAATATDTEPVEVAPAVTVPAETLDQQLVRICIEGPQPGEAFAGIMRHCHWQEAVKLAPTMTFVASGFEPDTCSTYWVQSVRYPGIIHSYADGTPSSNPSCKA